MSKAQIIILACAVVLVASIAIHLLAGSSTFTADGDISDSMCGRNHVMPGASSVECTQACVNAGAKYVFVSQSKIYALAGDMNSVKPYAGLHVHVSGKLDGSTVTIASIAAAK